MIKIEPHRPYLVLRHYYGTTFRYASWQDLSRCRDYERFLWGKLHYLNHGHFLANQHEWVYRNGESYYVRRGKTVIAEFSLRWDDGDPVSVGDKLYDYEKERARKKRLKAEEFRQKTCKKTLRSKSASKYKRRLRGWFATMPEEGEPPIRNKAGGIDPGFFDYESLDWRFIDRSWKRQSKRRHQWKPKP